MEQRTVTIVPEDLEAGSFSNYVTSSITTEHISLDFVCPMPSSVYDEGDEQLQINPQRLVARLHFTPGNLALIHELIGVAIEEQREWAEVGSKESGEEIAPPPVSKATQGYI